MRPMLTGYAGDERCRLVREAAGILGMIEVPKDGGAGVRLPARRRTDNRIILAPGERAVKSDSLPPFPVAAGERLRRAHETHAAG